MAFSRHSGLDPESRRRPCEGREPLKENLGFPIKEFGNDEKIRCSINYEPRTKRRKNMFGLGTQELVIIMIIVLVLFGASRLPEIGRGIGQAIKNFKKATSEPDEIDVTPRKSTSQEKKKEEIEKKEGE